jgi:hypothetical protein
MAVDDKSFEANLMGEIEAEIHIPFTLRKSLKKREISSVF